MAETVEIDAETHALLREMAEQDGVSMQEELARAVKALQRSRFFHQMDQGYAQLTAEERAEDAEEMARWDQTLADRASD